MCSSSLLKLTISQSRSADGNMGWSGKIALHFTWFDCSPIIDLSIAAEIIILFLEASIKLWSFWKRSVYDAPKIMTFTSYCNQKGSCRNFRLQTGWLFFAIQLRFWMDLNIITDTQCLPHWKATHLSFFLVYGMSCGSLHILSVIFIQSLFLPLQWEPQRFNWYFSKRDTCGASVSICMLNLYNSMVDRE